MPFRLSLKLNFIKIVVHKKYANFAISCFHYFDIMCRNAVSVPTRQVAYVSSRPSCLICLPLSLLPHFFLPSFLASFLTPSFPPLSLPFFLPLSLPSFLPFFLPSFLPSFLHPSPPSLPFSFIISLLLFFSFSSISSHAMLSVPIISWLLTFCRG